MAKTNTVLIKLKSSKSPHFYVKKKNPKTTTGKIQLMKFDPVVREHVLYKETKLS